MIYLYFCIYRIPNIKYKMIYFLTAIFLIVSVVAYMPVARKHGMVAGVNHRSSHSKPVVTGAGFIFYFSFLIYFIDRIVECDSCSLASQPWALFTGVTILAVISFLDDIHDVWFLYRLMAQILALALMMLQILISWIGDGFAMQASLVQWLAAFALLFISVGLLNMHNFIDGLNGMFGGLVCASLIPLILIDKFVIEFIDVEFLYMLLIPTVVFLFFNYRKQALCFSGDVGAIVGGMLMIYAVFILLIKSEGNVVYILLFAVILIESGLTILQRLLAGENIFIAHRMHLFQLYCNDLKRPHVIVSTVYIVIQFVISMGIFLMNYFNVDHWIQNLVGWSVFVCLSAIYLIRKRSLMGGHLLDYDEKFVTSPRKLKKMREDKERK